jgi:cytochrome P450
MQQLTPGLAPTALKTHYHDIVDHARALHERLQQYSDRAQTVDMQLELGKYPFQVLATVFFGESLSEQAYKDTARMVDGD